MGSAKSRMPPDHDLQPDHDLHRKDRSRYMHTPNDPTGVGVYWFLPGVGKIFRIRCRLAEMFGFILSLLFDVILLWKIAFPPWLWPHWHVRCYARQNAKIAFAHRQCQPAFDDPDSGSPRRGFGPP